MEPTVDPAPERAPEPEPRPIIITIVCVVGFIATALAVPVIFSNAAASIASWYPTVAAISIALTFVSLVGYWRMQRWGVYLYTALKVVEQIVVMSMGVWSLAALGATVLPAIIVAIGFANLSKMR